MPAIVDAPFASYFSSTLPIAGQAERATCNIDRKYFFFVSNEALYPNDEQRNVRRNPRDVYRQLLESHRTRQKRLRGGDVVMLSWPIAVEIKGHWPLQVAEEGKD